MADSNIKINITADDNASKKLKDLDNQVGKTEGGMGKLGKAAAVGGAALVALGVKSVMAFEDLGLTVGKFADATGTTAEQASRLIEVSGDLGISSETLQSSIGKMSKQLGANEEAFKSYGIEVAKNADGTTDVNETFLNAVDAINAIPDPLKKAEAAAKVFGKGYQGMAELLGQSSDEIRTDLAAVSDAKVFDDKKVQDARDMREAFDSIVDAGQDLLLTIGKSLAPAITKLAPVLVKVVEAVGPVAEALGEVLVSALEVVGPIIEALLPAIKLLADGLKLVANALSLLKPSGFTKGLESASDALVVLNEKALEAGLTQEEFQQIIDESAGAMAKTGDATTNLATLVDTATGRLDEMTTSASETDRETRRLGLGAVEAAASEVELTKASEELTKAERDNNNAIAAGITAQRDLTTARRDAIPGAGDLAQSVRDLDTAYYNLQLQEAENIETQDDHTLSQGAKDQSNRDLETSENNLGIKVFETAQKYAEAEGAVRGSKREQDLMTQSLEDAKAKYPELVGLINGYITALNNIPTDVDTVIRASGDGLDRRAAGGPAGGLTVVGEKGPELVDLPAGSYVHTAAETASMANGGGGVGGGGGNTVNLTVNAGLGTNGYEVAKVIVNNLAEYDRRNGTNIVTPVGR